MLPQGEVEVNGVPGDGTFQVAPAIFAIVTPSAFVVSSVAILLAFWNERIEWKGGWIAHYNCFGCLTVRCSISDIYNVFNEGTPFTEEYVEDTGFGRRARKRSIVRVAIEAAGEIKFREFVPRALELEALTKEAMRNRVPVQQMKAWQG